jgi:hypothetical protein
MINVGLPTFIEIFFVLPRVPQRGVKLDSARSEQPPAQNLCNASYRKAFDRPVFRLVSLTQSR